MGAAMILLNVIQVVPFFVHQILISSTKLGVPKEAEPSSHLGEHRTTVSIDRNISQ